MQEFAVFVIVGLAAGHAAWKLMPRALRARLAYATAGWAQRRGRLSDDDAAALASRLTGSGCGDCKSCGACGSTPNSPASMDKSPLRFERPMRTEERVDRIQ